MSSANSVSADIADRLRREILTGQYRAGERLPSERDLSARFSVSRGAIREALSQLDQQGIIEIQPGGVRVKPLERARLAILGPLLALNEVPDPELVDQFLEIFSVLTSLTVKGAVEQATPEQRLRLKQMVAEIEHRADDFEAMQPHWQALLEYMATIDNNLVARLIGNDIKAQVLGQMMQLNVKPVMPVQAGTELVRSLRTALHRQDGVAAASAFEKHFDQLRAGMRDALEAMHSGYRQQAV